MCSNQFHWRTEYDEHVVAATAAAKNYSAARRGSDTSAAAAAIATSLSALGSSRAILIPGDEKQVLLGKYQSSTLLKPSAPRHAAATVPPRTVQASLVRAWDCGGTDRPAVSPAAAPCAPPHTAPLLPLLLGWSRAVIPGLP